MILIHNYQLPELYVRSSSLLPKELISNSPPHLLIGMVLNIEIFLVKGHSSKSLKHRLQ